jgi:micrococcal nuclease
MRIATPLLMWLLVMPSLLVAETLTGRVVGVHDGDTLTVLASGRQEFKVRLSGIDAPELKQSHGQASKQALSDLAFGRDVRIEGGGPDKYGRTLGTVYVGSVNVNAALVEQGAAWVYRAYSYPKELERLEGSAQSDLIRKNDSASGFFLHRDKITVLTQ